VDEQRRRIPQGAGAVRRSTDVLSLGSFVVLGLLAVLVVGAELILTRLAPIGR
jgi:hypothetical protein